MYGRLLCGWVWVFMLFLFSQSWCWFYSGIYRRCSEGKTIWDCADLPQPVAETMAKMAQALLPGLKIIIHGSKLPLGFRLKETALAILRRGVSNCRRTVGLLRYAQGILIPAAPHSRSFLLLRSCYTPHPALPDARIRIKQRTENARRILRPQSEGWHWVCGF